MIIMIMSEIKITIIVIIIDGLHEASFGFGVMEFE